MRQLLHLLIVDAGRGAALAGQFGGRWLLPVLTCGERVRADRHALRWVTSRGFDADVAGQWLGRVGTTATDWLIVLTVDGEASGPDPQVSWTMLDELTAGAALLDYQGWAVVRSLEISTLPSVPGPFGRIGWTADVRAWIANVTGSICSCLLPYRTGAHEVVLGAHSASGPIYFKGLSAERAGEAHLTRLLAELEPSHFARTLALEERPDGSVWWLTAGCPGRPAVHGTVVASALARVQRRVMTSEPVLRELSMLHVEESFGWAGALVGDDWYSAAIVPLHETVINADLPRSWIPMDLDPVNVLEDSSGEVRFIDLDDSFVGPAPLAMALFAKRSRDRSSYGLYEQAWFPGIRGIDWPGFERAVAVLDAWLGWRRVVRNTCRGELYGALELAEARVRDRLVRILHRW